MTKLLLHLTPRLPIVLLVSVALLWSPFASTAFALDDPTPSGGSARVVGDAPAAVVSAEGATDNPTPSDGSNSADTHLTEESILFTEEEEEVPHEEEVPTVEEEAPLPQETPAADTPLITEELPIETLLLLDEQPEDNQPSGSSGRREDRAPNNNDDDAETLTAPVGALLISLKQSSDSHRHGTITTVTALPPSPTDGDVIRFTASASSLTNTYDTDGSTAKTTAAANDMFRYESTGTKWVFMGNGATTAGISSDVDDITNDTTPTFIVKSSDGANFGGTNETIEVYYKNSPCATGDAVPAAAFDAGSTPSGWTRYGASTPVATPAASFEVSAGTTTLTGGTHCFFAAHTPAGSTTTLTSHSTGYETTIHTAVPTVIPRVAPSIPTGTPTKFSSSGDVAVTPENFGIFGNATALSADGTLMAVGAFTDGGGKGEVFLFEKTNGTWTETLKISDSAAAVGTLPITLESGDNFGSGVALSADGTLLAVGAEGDDDGGTDKGAVYIFEKSGATWAKILKISDNNGGNVTLLDINLTADDEFGAAVSLSADGTTLAVGASDDNDGNGHNAAGDEGAVYIFEKTNGVWAKTLKISENGGGSELLNIDLTTGDYFGSSVSLSADGTLLAVGAISDDDGGGAGTNRGAVYLFQKSSGAWSRIHKFSDHAAVTEEGTRFTATATDINLTNGDMLGTAVSLSADGTLLAAGATGDNGSKGAAYFFQKSGTTWMKTHKISDHTASATDSDRFTATETDIDLTANDNFGSGVALSGDGTALAVGAGYADGSNGEAYTFTITPTPTASATVTAVDSGSDTVMRYVKTTGTQCGTTQFSGGTGTPYTEGSVITATGADNGKRFCFRSEDEAGNIGYGISAALSIETNEPTVIPRVAPSIPTGAPTEFSSTGDVMVTADPYTSFGSSTALSADGTLMAVGHRSGGGSNRKGAVYLFEKADGAWAETLEISDSTAAEGILPITLPSDGYFGYSVSLSADGTLLAVGAADEGAVYLFEKSDTGWAHTLEISDSAAAEGILPIDLDSGDKFGSGVALSADGTTLAVGTRQDDDGDTGITNRGAVYLFQKTNNVWAKTLKISDNDGGTELLNIDLSNNDEFGNTVSLSADGTVLAVGAHNDDDDDGATGDDNNRGAIYLFQKTNSAWTKTLKISDNGGGSELLDINLGNSDKFGTAVSLSADGALLAVGAKNDDDGGANSNRGAAYLFQKTGTTWAKTHKISDHTTSVTDSDRFTATETDIDLTSAGGIGDNFGSGIALSGDGTALAVGAEFADSNKGAAYVFTMQPTPTASATVTAVDDRSNTATMKYVKTTGTDCGATQFPGATGTQYPEGTMITVNTEADNGKRICFRSQDSDGNVGYGISAALVIDTTTPTVIPRVAPSIPSGAPTKFSHTGDVALTLDNNNQFGIATAFSADGMLMAVGTPNDGDDGDPGGNSNRGAVYLFQKTAGVWAKTLKISDNGGGSAELLDINLSNNDHFGHSVSLSADGTLLAVGANGDDDRGSDSVGNNRGAVYLFQKSDTGWAKILKISDNAGGSAELLNIDLSNNDEFGSAVSLSADGTTLAVGVPDDDDGNGNNASGDEGAVYLFQKSDTGWAKTLKISDNGGGTELLDINLSNSDGFGFGVSLSADGALLAVGANGDDDGGGSRGAVYLFENTGTVWQQARKFSDHTALPGATDRFTATETDINLANNDNFGNAVSLSADGTQLAVGAYIDGDGGSSKGAAYLFRKSNNTWARAHKVSDHTTAPDASTRFTTTATDINVDGGDRFGVSVALSADGTALAVGAYGDDDGGNTRGAVYAFNITPTPTATATITAVDTEDSTTMQYVKITDTICGAAQFAGGTGTPYTEGDAIDITTEADNNKRFCFMSEDGAGNTGYSISVNPNVDTTAPVLSFVNPVSDDDVVSDTIRVTADEAGFTGYGFSDDNTCTDGETANTISGRPLTHTQRITTNNDDHLCYRAEDTAGNIAYLVSAEALNIISGTASTDATLSALSLSTGTLTPTFTADTHDYTASVANSVTSVTVTATPTHAEALVTGITADTDSTVENREVDLTVGANIITVSVIAQDGSSTQDYTVTVTREANTTAAPASITLISDTDTITPVTTASPHGTRDTTPTVSFTAPDNAVITAVFTAKPSGAGALSDSIPVSTTGASPTLTTTPVSGNTDTYTLQLPALSVDGNYTIGLNALVAPMSLSTQTTYQFTLDTIVPTVAVTIDTDPVLSGTATVTATFSEPVTGFTSRELTATAGATLSGFSGSGRTYTATLTPDANTEATVTLAVAANVATDNGGNNNTADSVTVEIDTTPLEVSILELTTGTVYAYVNDPLHATVPRTKDDVALADCDNRIVTTGAGWVDYPVGDGVAFSGNGRCFIFTERDGDKIAAHTYNKKAGVTNLAVTNANTVSGVRYTNDTTPVFTGSVESGATVSVYTASTGGTPIATATATGTAFTATVQAGNALSTGQHTIYTTVTLSGWTESARVSQFTLEVDETRPAAPTIASASGTSGTDTTPTFTVTAEVGASVRLYTNNQCTTATGTAATVAVGDTTVDIETDALGVGTHTIYAKQTDPAGNASPCSTSGADYQVITVSAAVSLTDPGTLTENNLNDATVTVTLNGTTFVDASSLDASDFDITGITGLTADDVSRTDNTNAVLTLDLADGSDFDTDDSFTVTVKDAGHAGTGNLTTGSTTVTANHADALEDVAATAGDRGVTLSWTRAPETVTGYEYRQKAGSGNYGSWTTMTSGDITTSANTKSYTVTGLINTTAYTFEIRAVTSGGDGVPSAQVSATPAPRSRVQHHRPRRRQHYQ